MEVIRLHFVEGLQHEEVGRRFNIGRHAVGLVCALFRKLCIAQAVPLPRRGQVQPGTPAHGLLRHPALWQLCRRSHARHLQPASLSAPKTHEKQIRVQQDGGTDE